MAAAARIDLDDADGLSPDGVACEFQFDEESSTGSERARRHRRHAAAAEAIDAFESAGKADRGVTGDTTSARAPERTRVDWDAATYDRVSDPQESWAPEVLARLALEGDETVLDAGCGSGR